MFLTPKELNTAMYAHVVGAITQDNAQVVEQCIAAAIEELKSYLAQRYDTERIFNASGTERNALIVEHVKVITAWNIIRLSSAEVIYEAWRDRYDRVIVWAKAVAKGSIAPELPPLTNDQGDVELTTRFGSNPKFTHHF